MADNLQVLQNAAKVLTDQFSIDDNAIPRLADTLGSRTLHLSDRHTLTALQKALRRSTVSLQTTCAFLFRKESCWAFQRVSFNTTAVGSASFHFRADRDQVRTSTRIWASFQKSNASGYLSTKSSFYGITWKGMFHRPHIFTRLDVPQSRHKLLHRPTSHHHTCRARQAKKEFVHRRNLSSPCHLHTYICTANSSLLFSGAGHKQSASQGDKTLRHGPIHPNRRPNVFCSWNCRRSDIHVWY